IEGDTEQHARTGIGEFQTALVGSVRPDMPAAATDLQKGDIITRLDGKIIDAGTFVETISSITDGRAVTAEIERNGERKSIALSPRPVGAFKDVVFGPPLDWPDRMDESKPLPVTEEDSAKLAGTGFVNGDRIVSIDGAPVRDGIVRAIAGRPETDTLQVALERRGLFGIGAAETVTLPSVTVAQFLEAITSFDVAAKPEVLAVDKKVSDATGLQAQDIVEEVDGEPATWALLAAAQQAHVGGSVSLKVRKPAIAMGALRGESTTDVTLPVAAIGKVGIGFEPRKVFYRAPLARVLPEAMRETVKVVKLTVRTLTSLVSGDISARELGGPIMIYQITTTTARFGSAGDLISITALISVNLAIFNLLPLPVLDGGHLLFLGIEAIRRKPVSARVMDWVQQAGLMFIIGLMLFVTYNDIGRLIRGWLP
ncbi:MAG: PDZ domain-containing protein, partial [Candidatus Hydrogenedentes bacterium]|nr:PDZ domain-containing protein [Candidatus Hydrogenedentota bacterium]